MRPSAVRWPWLPWRWGEWGPLLRCTNPAVKREAWGYVFWIPVIVLLFLPAELIPAFGVGGWPTFSTTIGHLELLWGPVAILVVVLMVFTGVNAYTRRKRHRVERAKQGRPGATAGLYRDDVDGGRLIWRAAKPAKPVLPTSLSAVRLVDGPIHVPAQRPPDAPADRAAEGQPENWIRMRVYIIGSAIVIAAVAYPTFEFAGYWWGAYVMWGAIAFFVLVFPSILAWRFATHVLFPTLFRTVGNLQARYQMVGTAVIGFVAVLGIHLSFYPWPNIAHVLKTASPQNPSISGKAVTGSTVTVSGDVENCIRPEGIVVKSKAFTGDVTGEVKDSHYSVQAKLASTPTKGETVTVYCGSPKVGETHFR